MEKFPKVRFFPVIHVVDSSQMLYNIKTAQDSGADGVFLIHHYLPACDFSDFLNRIDLSIYAGGFPIGVNFLGVSTPRASQFFTSKFFALWGDDSGVRENGVGVENGITQFVLGEIRGKNPSGEFFGGVAFKYQRQPKNLCQVVKAVSNAGAIVTTSGKATGEPPDVDKVKLIRTMLNNPSLRLANASGVDEKNIRKLAEAGVTDFLVATSLLYSGMEEFRPGAVCKMAEIVKEINSTR